MTDQQIELPSAFSWVDLDDYQFSSALDEILNGHDNLFVQARAGCGKSLLVKILHEMEDDGSVAVLATTGTAAQNFSQEGIPATTIHSFFCLKPVEWMHPDDDTPGWPYCRKGDLKTIRTIVIDEASMLNCNVFDTIVRYLEKAAQKHCTPDDEVPRIILFGDVLQLPPVISEDTLKKFFEPTYGKGKTMFFNAKSYQKLGFKTIQLSRSYRQADEDFANAIYSIGVNSFDQGVLDYFNAKKTTLEKYDVVHGGSPYIYMATTNAAVNRVNAAYLDSLNGASHVYKALVSKNWPKDVQLPVEKEIELRVGAQVMMTRNKRDDRTGAFLYTNGQIGTVLDLNDYSALVRLRDGSEVTVGCYETPHYELKEVEVVDKKTNKTKKKMKNVPVATVKQIACKICKAMTVHKSQGKTLEDAYFAPVGGWTPPGLIYVGLSRLTSLDGLGLSRDLTMKDVQVYKEAIDFLSAAS